MLLPMVMPAQKAAVLKVNQFNVAIFPENYRYTYYEMFMLKIKAKTSIDTSSFVFVPTDTIESALALLKNFVTLDSINKNISGFNCAVSPTQLSAYNVQVFCYKTKRKEKIILFNFLSTESTFSVPFDSGPCFPNDGCNQFWTIKYNVNKRVLFDIQVNGKG